MKIVLVILFILIPLTISAQRNSYYLSFQPGDLGIGLRYDHNDFYGSGSWGNYRFSSGSYIKNHIRLAAGYKLDVPKEIGFYAHNYFSLGLVYHYYGEMAAYGFELNKQEGLFPLSVEIGTGVRIKRVVACFRFDVIKFEGVIDVGITFR
jgi:hypothetical protein